MEIGIVILFFLFAGAKMNFSMSSEDIADIEIRSRDQSRNPLWFSYRTGRITASSFQKIQRVSVGNFLKHAIYYQRIDL